MTNVSIIDQDISDGRQLDSNARGYVINAGLDWIDLELLPLCG